MRLRRSGCVATSLQGRCCTQPELRPATPCARWLGPYVQLPSRALLRRRHLSGAERSACPSPTSPSFPLPADCSAACLNAQPLLVEGRLLAPASPRSCSHLEALVRQFWLVRTAELISCRRCLPVCGRLPNAPLSCLWAELLATAAWRAAQPALMPV